MDLILSQFNLDSPLPTFFEMRAQDELMPMLKGAFKYGLTVTAQRMPRLVSFLDWTDEIFGIIWILIDARFLNAGDSTFSENFYGMKRVVLPAADDPPKRGGEEERQEESAAAPAAGGTPEAAGGGEQAPPTQGSAEGGFSGVRSQQPEQLGRFLQLTRRDRLYTLAVTVLVPYLRSKLAAKHLQLREETPDQVAERQRWEDELPRWRGALARAARQGMLHVYPWVNAVYEGITFVYWLRYLFVSQWWSPWNHARRILLKRMDMHDYINMQTGPNAAFTERTKGFLMCIVVFFKVLEWWHSTESVRTQEGDEGQHRVTAPPPPRPVVDLSSLTESQCPQCKQRTTNPTLNASSGYVYCYPCIHQYVEANRKDPVTQIPCSLDHLRRIYETAA